MANNLTGRIKDMSTRVEALENEGIDSAESLAQIELLTLGDIDINISVSTTTHYSKVAGTFNAGVFIV